MPYEFIEPDVFLEHRGIVVFCTYSDPFSGRCDYWFTLDPTHSDGPSFTSGTRFDARRFAGFSETPSVGDWNAFWKPRFREEREAVSALIRTAIDEGKLPAAEAWV